MLTSFINNFFIAFFHKKVGEDGDFNKYYESKKLDYLGYNKRFVVYNNIKSTKIPPMWYAWLHHMINDVPRNIDKVSEQKIVLPKTSTRYSRWEP
jgi:NADH:ubiquinone oxidoreductase subunit